MKHNIISQETLKEYLDYNQNTGVFTWIKSTSDRIKKGMVAGRTLAKKNEQYVIITLFNKKYRAHRLAWIYVNGSIEDGLQIDHINNIENDNRISNLRLATPSQNTCNRNKSRKSKNKNKGVWYDAKRKKYQAMIAINRKPIHLGRFDTLELANEAYKAAAIKYHGEFACWE